MAGKSDQHREILCAPCGAAAQEMTSNKFAVQNLTTPINIKRNPRAKRLQLRVCSSVRQAVLTMPPHCSDQQAERFLQKHMNWLTKKLAEIPAAIPFKPGAEIPLRGVMHRIQCAESLAAYNPLTSIVTPLPAPNHHEAYAAGEAVMSETMPGNAMPDNALIDDALMGDALMSDALAQDPAPFAGETLIDDTKAADGLACENVTSEMMPLLVVRGREEHIGRRLQDWLKRQARADLSTASAHYAKQLGLKFRRLHIRDQATRWGSCTSNGTLSFSWRLVLAPPAILNYVAAHEIAHLEEMNHSAAFWALVEKIYPNMEEARQWLNQHGAELHRYGS